MSKDYIEERSHTEMLKQLILPTWTIGVEALSGLKLNLQPKDRADSEKNVAVMIGLKQNLSHLLGIYSATLHTVNMTRVLLKSIFPVT